MIMRLFRFKSKKGDMNSEILVQIYNLLLAAVLLLMLLAFVKSIETGEYLKKEYLSKDIALMIDTVSISSYEIKYDYTGGVIGLGDFYFNFIDGKVSSAEAYPKRGVAIPVFYPYGVDKRIGLSYRQIINESIIEMHKKPSFFYIGFHDNKSYEHCIELDTKATDWLSRTFVIDIGNGGEDKGFIGSVVESEENRNKARLLNGYLKSAGAGRVDLTRSFEVEETINNIERINRINRSNADVVVSIHTGFDINPYIYDALIYINSESPRLDENRKLSCILKNNLINKGYNNVEIIRIRADSLSYDDPRSVLRTKDMSKVSLGMYVETGNVLNPDLKIIQRERGEIAKAIYDSLRSYYG
jgi:N-acetylmuramoyl-L-alanine amidase